MRMDTHPQKFTHCHLFSSPEFIQCILRFSILRHLIVEEMSLMKFKVKWKGRLKESVKQNKVDWIMCFSPQTVCNAQFHPAEPRKIFIISSTQGYVIVQSCNLCIICLSVIHRHSFYSSPTSHRNSDWFAEFSPSWWSENVTSQRS